MSPEHEARLCRFLANRLTVDVSKALAQIVDAAMVEFPRASATEVANTLVSAITECNVTEVAAYVRAHSVAASIERRAA